MDKIYTKWGFGNAPLKPSHIAKTEAAIRTVIAIFDSVPETSRVEHLEALSHAKGQFTRIIKQDQWDWFTVWSRLGRPTRQSAYVISKTLGNLRTALKEGDIVVATKAVAQLRRTQVSRCFNSFLAGDCEHHQQSGVHGFIYILSIRSQPRILKIGVTQRTVEIRVKEINRATGVIVPYGVRAVWRVESASAVEQEIHALFAPFRIRADREFFELDFLEARRLINDYLNARRNLKQTE